MYALDSAHEKVRRLNRCRTFAVLFDWRRRIVRRVDPNTNVPLESAALICSFPNTVAEGHFHKTPKLGHFRS